MIPKAKPGGRPREVDMWEILNAIFYVLVEGVRWRSLPGDFPAWQTVYTYFRTWRKDETWLQLHDRLRDWTNRAGASSESIGSNRRQSKYQECGDGESIGELMRANIKGRKRFLTVDSLGLVCEFWSPQRVLENERVANKCSSKSKDG